jgi:hypothetical protein
MSRSSSRTGTTWTRSGRSWRTGPSRSSRRVRVLRAAAARAPAATPDAPPPSYPLVFPISGLKPLAQPPPQPQVGCGAGNAVYPLLEANPQLRAFACDFSPRAVEVRAARPPPRPYAGPCGAAAPTSRLLLCAVGKPPTPSVPARRSNKPKHCALFPQPTHSGARHPRAERSSSSATRPTPPAASPPSSPTPGATRSRRRAARCPPGALTLRR